MPVLNIWSELQGRASHEQLLSIRHRIYRSVLARALDRPRDTGKGIRCHSPAALLVESWSASWNDDLVSWAYEDSVIALSLIKRNAILHGCLM